VGAAALCAFAQKARGFPNLSNGPLRFRCKRNSTLSGKKKPHPFRGRKERGTQNKSPHEGFATRPPVSGNGLG